jgi:hypothetical protein
VFAQHLAASGEPLWQANGVHMGGAPGSGVETEAAFASDGRGGFWLTWAEMDTFDPDVIDVSAGHYLASGAPAEGTPAGGLVICDAPGNQHRPLLVSLDGSQVLAAWVDERSGNGDMDFYVWPSQSAPVRTPRRAVAHANLPFVARSIAGGGLEVEFEVAEPGPVSFLVGDVQGRVIRRLSIEAGSGRRSFSIGRTEIPGSGIYFVRMEQHGRATTRKVPILR